MRDMKAPLMIAVPAAITVLGIVWFLRKMTADEKKDGKSGKSTKRTTPQVDKKETPNPVNTEGITLTQRKIPDTEEYPLTDSEREKVKEIVEAAIGAGLREARGEVIKATTTLEDKEAGHQEISSKIQAEDEIEEEIMTQSYASAQSCMSTNNNRGYNTTIKEREGKSNQQNDSLIQGNFIDNNAIADFFTQEQTTPDKGQSSSVPKHCPSESFSSSSANVVTLSPSTLPPSNDQSVCNAVPLESQISTITKQADGEAVVASSSSTPADLSNPSLSSPSSLPSNMSDNISKDSVLNDSSVVSDLKLDNTVASSINDSLSSSSLEPSEKAPQVGSASHTEQPEVKTEDSSSSSQNSTSPVCDNNSVGSSDSGRGGSEHDVTSSSDGLIHFDFNMPSELCGRLIGKKGYNINQLKIKSGANVSLTHNPLSAEFQICQVVGTQSEIDEALRLIRTKFPLEDHPHLTMAPVTLPLPKEIDSSAPVIVPDNMQLSLPDGASVEVYVSTIVDAGHVFVQQPTHRTFMSLEKLNFFLNAVYGQDDSIPCLPQPIECGVICVCENEGSWYRAMVMTPEDEFGQCQVKFVDYGGYTQLPISCIKQIRADFMNLPFQAVECFVANIAPLQGEEYFSTESTMALSEMSQMKLLQCQVVARNEIGTPYIHLYLVSPETNSATMVNRALVNNRLVRWVEIL